MKINNKIWFAMFAMNIKKIFLYIPFLIFISIFFILNFAFVFIFNSSFFEGVISGVLTSRNLIYIKFGIDIFLITIINLFVILFLFRKQYLDGMHKIEKRLGVSSKKIFWIRFVIAKILLWSTLFITFLTVLISFSLMNNLSNELYLTKLIQPFGFYFLFDIFIFAIILCLVCLTHQILSIFLTIFISMIIVLNPLFFSYKYFNDYKGQMELSKLKNQVVLTAKLNMGNEFKKFLEEYNEYNFLINEFSGLNISWNDGVQHHWELYERAFYFGDIFFSDFKEEFEKNSPTIFKMFNDINNSLYENEWNQYCSANDLMFNYGQKDISDKRYNEGMCNISNFSIYLKNKNIKNGAYNNLFTYISKSSKYFQIFNEMNDVISFAPGTKGGLIFKYGHIDENEASLESLTLNYKTPMQLIFNWYLLNLLKYSLTFDTQQLITIKEQDKIINQFKLKNNLNVFFHFTLLWMGKTYKNKTLDDVWAINNTTEIGTINNYFNVQLTEEQKLIDTSIIKNDFKFDIEKSDLDEANVSEIKSIVIYEIMFLSYFIIFSAMNYLGFILYNKRWN